MITNVIKSIKWSVSKQLVGYIVTCCIALASSLPLLAGFAVESLLAEVLRNTVLLGTSSISYAKILVGNWGDYCFLTSLSCCLHYPHCTTVLLWTRAQADTRDNNNNNNNIIIIIIMVFFLNFIKTTKI